MKNQMENMDGSMQDGQSERIEPPEKLINVTPKLRGIEKVLALLESEELPDGEKINWKDIDQNVGAYHSMLEFSDNVREAVRTYVEMKIPKFIEALPVLGDLDEKALLNALTHNWFEELEREETEEVSEMSVDGTRRQVLLTVAAHVVKRIETRAEQKLLLRASEEQLQELGLTASVRDLLIELLEIGAKSDPLFVRFLAYSQLSGKPPEKASPTGMHLPGDPSLHTMAEFFPHEAKFIAGRLEGILLNAEKWKDISGANEFMQYLDILRQIYTCTDVAMAPKLQQEAMERYAAVLATDFPILVTSATEGYYKEPYLDPELKISVASPEARREEQDFEHARDLMTDHFVDIGAEKFSDSVRSRPVRSSVVLGGYGANLSFNAVAQETPVNLLFLNEQIRSYDSRFVEVIHALMDTDAFDGLSTDEKKERMEKMSRFTTMLHEFGHPVHPSESEEGKRLGRKPLTVIDELKAESLWRPLVPKMTDEGLEGTAEQWAIAMITGSLLLIKDQPEDDPYYLAGIYCLNNLFEKGIVQFKFKKIFIPDVDAYYAATKEMAIEIMSLYEDGAMTERKASRWVKEKCEPSRKLEKVIAYVKTLPY